MKIEVVLNSAGSQNNTTVHMLLVHIPQNKWDGHHCKQNMTLHYPLSYEDKTRLRGLQEHFLT